ncbi:MAG: ABC transporter ATP-binding protein, partial [Bacteroidales bacterium]|nr:ABC transporter ATP-binding protein [Bacteroidales bacterium]
MSDFKWLWDKLGKDKGKYIIALVLAILVSFASIVVPHMSRIIVDRYITGPNSVYNIQHDKMGLIYLIVFVIGF